MNILVAFIIFMVVYATGAPSNRASTKVAEVESNTPAAAAGLQVGDRVVAVNGTPATTFDQLSALIRVEPRPPDHGHRRSRRPDRDARPARDEKSAGSWIFGFVPGGRARVVSAR